MKRIFVSFNKYEHLLFIYIYKYFLQIQWPFLSNIFIFWLSRYASGIIFLSCLFLHFGIRILISELFLFFPRYLCPSNQLMPNQPWIHHRNLPTSNREYLSSFKVCHHPHWYMKIGWTNSGERGWDIYLHKR